MFSLARVGKVLSVFLNGKPVSKGSVPGLPLVTMKVTFEKPGLESFEAYLLKGEKPLPSANLHGIYQPIPFKLKEGEKMPLKGTIELWSEENGCPSWHFILASPWSKPPLAIKVQMSDGDASLRQMFPKLFQPSP